MAADGARRGVGAGLLGCPPSAPKPCGPASVSGRRRGAAGPRPSATQRLRAAGRVGVPGPQLEGTGLPLPAPSGSPLGCRCCPVSGIEVGARVLPGCRHSQPLPASPPPRSSLSGRAASLAFPGFACRRGLT